MSDIYTIDTETALAEEKVGVVAKLLPNARTAYDSDGDVVGVVYYDAGSRKHYAADLNSLISFVETYRRTRGVDAYSVWCSETTPDAEAATLEEVLADMDWALGA